MGNLNFMDLKRQYQNIKQDMLDAFLEVCENTAFSGGAYAERFEKEFAEYLGVSYFTGLDNGTSALDMAMLALNIGPGDEVIVPANTYIASAWGAIHAGAKIVFVDCLPDTWEIDPDEVSKAVTEKTKAVIGVHLYGQPFDIYSVKKITDEHNIYLIEDCAQAHGATYKGKMVGSFGEMGCFSFYPGKNLGAFGEAGGVSSNNKEYIDYINMAKNQGCAVRYYHDVIGYNRRLDGIQGAILSKKLKYLPVWTERRREIAGQYFNGINNPKIVMQMQREDSKSVFHIFPILVDERKSFMSYMEDMGINCGIHYPVPCHLQKATSYLGYKEGDIPNAEYQSAHCVSLPMFPEMTDEETNKVIDACNKY